MAFLQTRFCDSARFQISSLKASLLKSGLLKRSFLKADSLKSSFLESKLVKSISLGAKLVKSISLEAKLMKSISLEAKLMKSISLEAKLMKSSSLGAKLVKSSFLESKLVKSISLEAKLMKSSSGFLTLTLISFLSLMFLILIGFSLVSVGIKNTTQAQSDCLKELSQTQKKLGEKLEQLLKLNQKVHLLDKTRKGLDASIAAALASIIFIPKAPNLKKSKDLVKLGQKNLIAAQKGILIQSRLIKREQIRKLRSQLKILNANWIIESSFYRKALAVEKEEIGDEAYIYKPVEEFKTKQKIKVSWNLPAFYPLEKDLNWIFRGSSFRDNNFTAKPLNFNSSNFNPFHFFRSSYSKAFSIKQSCAVTLEQKGEQWVYRLSH